MQLLQQTIVAAAHFFLYTFFVHTKFILFQEKLKKIYPSQSQQILETISKPRQVTFRPNLLVKSDITPTEYPELSIKPAPFNCFSIPSDQKASLSNSALVNQGEIYIQGISSMLPVYALTASPTDKILDLCAAPGSKTSLISALTSNQSEITAVDNNISRLRAMKANMATLNVKNVTFVRSDASAISRDPSYINYFDKVLTDVPCSNEGLIRDPYNYDFSTWNPRLSKRLPKLQKRILASGISMLKPGGTLVYSTCTYSPEENELVIDWALKKFPEMQLVQLEDHIISLGNTVPGFTNWKGKDLTPALNKTLRILPTDLFDGFYIAKMTKSS